MNRRCVQCKQWKSVKEFSLTKHADGRIRPRSYCRPCDSRKTMERRERNGRDEERRKKVDRARDRARSKLARVCPELYRTIYLEELAKEGVEPSRHLMTYVDG